MTEWWESLTGMTRFFYGAAAFFSVAFIWQLISALIGLDHHDAGDGHFEDGHIDDSTGEDGVEATVAFKLLSVRSIITFCTLFSWGSALYLNRGEPASTALALSAVWGLAGMLSVSLIFWGMRKLTYTGTKKLSSCVGTTGTVYLNIPEKGFGEIKVTVSGVLSNVKASSASGAPLSANTPVRVVRMLGQTTVEVEPIE